MPVYIFKKCYNANLKTYQCIPINHFTNAVTKLKLTTSISLHEQLHYKERDCKSTFLFRACFVAANLVTPLEFDPLRCATTVCHFGETQSGSMATHFILLSSIDTISATDDYIAVLEGLSQNEQQFVEIRNELGTFLVPFQKKKLDDAHWSHVCL